MLILNNNSQNVIILTLTENINNVSITGSTTGYTMDLINETTNEVFSGITLTDISVYTDRYNEFVFELTTLPLKDYTTTKVYLKDEGMYVYKAYYNTDNQRELLQQGFFKVIGEADLITTLDYTNNDDSSYFSYEN